MIGYKEKISKHVREYSASPYKKKAVVVLAVDDSGNVHYLPKTLAQVKKPYSYTKIRNAVVKRR